MPDTKYKGNKSILNVIKTLNELFLKVTEYPLATEDNRKAGIIQTLNSFSRNINCTFTTTNAGAKILEENAELYKNLMRLEKLTTPVIDSAKLLELKEEILPAFPSLYEQFFDSLINKSPLFFPSIDLAEVQDNCSIVEYEMLTDENFPLYTANEVKKYCQIIAFKYQGYLLENHMECPAIGFFNENHIIRAVKFALEFANNIENIIIDSPHFPRLASLRVKIAVDTGKFKAKKDIVQILKIKELKHKVNNVIITKEVYSALNEEEKIQSLFAPLCVLSRNGNQECKRELYISPTAGWSLPWSCFFKKRKGNENGEGFYAARTTTRFYTPKTITCTISNTDATDEIQANLLDISLKGAKTLIYNNEKKSEFTEGQVVKINFTKQNIEIKGTIVGKSEREPRQYNIKFESILSEENLCAILLQRPEIKLVAEV